MPHASPGLRVNGSVQAVLRTLLADPTREYSGPELSAASGLAGSRIHPVLARLDGVGWVSSRWGVGPAPRTRYYRLQPDAIAAARAVIAQHSNTPCIHANHALIGAEA